MNQRAIDLINHAFFGNTISMVSNKFGHTVVSNHRIRDAIKYVSLSPYDRSIWDDPKMSKAQKYQNIPQIDISTYKGDYEVPPVRIDETSGNILIHILYSASREVVDITLPLHDALYHRFLDMSGIDRVELLLWNDPDALIRDRENSLIFHAQDHTDLIVDETPYYYVTMEKLFQKFQEDPEHCYVPYRRGWSRLLNIREIHPNDNMFTVMYENNEVAHLHPSSSISVWDGISMRTENHGVQVESVINVPVDQFIREDINPITKMRMLNGTHEHIRDVKVTYGAMPNPKDKFYAVWAIKGINIHGFEFNMS